VTDRSQNRRAGIRTQRPSFRLVRNLLLLLCILISHELIEGVKYKVLYQTNNNELAIYYFYDPDQEGIPSLERNRLQGVEIYRDGDLIKDTFPGNNRI